MDKASVEPSYRQVAERYKEASPAVVQQLISKDQHGRLRVWGERAMPAHPHLKYSEVKNGGFHPLLDDADNTEGLPLSGKFAFRKHQEDNTHRGATCMLSRQLIPTGEATAYHRSLPAGNSFCDILFCRLLIMI